jgi:DNA-binding NtrC family response regulator
MLKIYVIDDERIIRISTADDLRDAGYNVFEFASAKAALLHLKENDGDVDIIITDLKMPEMDGLELVRKVKEVKPEIYVLLMTAHAAVDTAVEAMKLGAWDYISKPFSMDEMLMTIKRIEELKEIKDENEQLRTQISKKFDLSSFVGQSKKTKELFNHVEKIAHKPTTVLINGETGTGKELLTNLIHYNSDRSKKPLVKVSCAILSREIFESELFGHVKGAFTGAETSKKGRFEMADKGTLYLDDIDDVPYDLQVKLLRALEESEIERVGGTETIKIDVRVIASTKKDLKQMVAEGKFREDLFYRLNVFPLYIPPLRERPGDIELLAKHFALEFSQGKTSIDPEVLEILKQYQFPGNVREIKNLMERLVLLSDGNIIDKKVIPIDIRFPDKQHTCIYFENKPLEEFLKEVETKAIRDALMRSGGNKAKAAEILSIPASTLKSKIDKLGIEKL